MYFLCKTFDGNFSCTSYEAGTDPKKMQDHAIRGGGGGVGHVHLDPYVTVDVGVGEGWLVLYF